jgi:hypothetical protein
MVTGDYTGEQAMLPVRSWQTVVVAGGALALGAVLVIVAAAILVAVKLVDRSAADVTRR